MGLNARQATFEHCKLQLSTFIAVFLFAWLLVNLHNDPDTKNKTPEVAPTAETVERDFGQGTLGLSSGNGGVHHPRPVGPVDDEDSNSGDGRSGTVDCVYSLGEGSSADEIRWQQWKENVTNNAHYAMLYASYYILVVSIAAFAVQFRLRWLMLPWLVTEAASIIIGIPLSIYEIYELFAAMASQIMTALAIAAFAVYFLGLMAFGLYLGVVSFREFGAANRAALINIPIELRYLEQSRQSRGHN